MIKNVKLEQFFKPFSCDGLIRLGKDNDGGYLVEKNSILNSDALLSFGIDHDWSFEKDFKNYNRSTIHTYDGSVGPRFFASKLKLRILGTFKYRSKEYFKVSKYWFLLPIRFYRFFKIIKTQNGPNHYEKFIGKRKNQISLKDAINNLPLNKTKIFLKIDIENSEYEVLNEIIENSNLLTGLVIEFHSVNNNINTIKNFIESFNLKLVHIHINNYGTLEAGTRPSVIELSFSKFYKPEKILSLLPHKLDQSNDINSWTYILNFEN